MAFDPTLLYRRNRDAGQLRLSDYTSVLKVHWRLIVKVALAVFALGVLYVLLAPPTYRADALIQVDNQNPNTDPAFNQLAAIFNVRTTSDTEMEVLGARLVIGEAVRKLHLDIEAKPRRFPLLGGLTARFAADGQPGASVPGLRGFAWGGERIDVSRFDIPSSLFNKQFVVTATGDGRFELTDPQGTLVADGVVGTVVTGTTAYGPVKLLIDKLVSGPGTEFTLTRSPLLETITDLQNKLIVAERVKQSGMIGIALEGPDRQKATDTVNTIAREYFNQNNARKESDAERSLALFDQQLPRLRAEVDDAEQRYNAFRETHGAVNLDEESRLLLQQAVELDTKLTDLKQQSSDLAQRFNVAHPAVASVDAQIVDLQRRRDALSRQVAGLPALEQALMRLQREVRVSTSLYTNLLNRAQELRVAKAAQALNVRVVDFALSPDRPVKPKVPLVLALSSVFGLLLGTVCAFVRQAGSGGTESSYDIVTVTGVPVSAVVMRSDRQARLQKDARRSRGGPPLLAVHDPKDVAVEGIRNLRTMLQFADVSTTNPVIALTGPHSEVGKSFLAANLAAVMATDGKRVAIVDADMRRGDVHDYFGASASPGLAEVLEGDAVVEDALIRDVAPDVDLLPCGSYPSRPADLLNSARFAALIEQLSLRYDKVIIDTPPILAVTDAMLVCKHAGTILMVVRYGKESLEDISESVGRLRVAGMVPSGILFNDIPPHSRSYSSYYGHA
ncbi:polysaccharide biosynthesis tyrosine autokinase [Paraburkholderia sp. MMS20-SJTN17]|uniref:Polysaccharide biosynthesis tyrosine autokinase n=1 Tax=Paraburkholderia translucens TaxID=2886945 RepID=A0ABS8K952_9BURK|nr:polysaccharide biosynthesis tyrosine autokinase [Paraburkholderia sp. MMS20-SJTN17]MCC8401285.1 polysaccharide biosynthesis tyrosine autokinase [Paraburkholderia sp. MMS20-SJTN17]